MLTDPKDISFRSHAVMLPVMGDSKDSLPSGNGVGPVALKVMAQVADACLCLPASYYAASMVYGRAIP